MRIAIVGSGIAGLTCAHVLGPHHDVEVFEASDRLGGHSNTVEVNDPEAGTLGVDTGFIVHNDRNYPNLVRLFDELGVEVADTEMSFGVTDSDPSSPTRGFTYRATNLDTLFADRTNLRRPAMWRMLLDIAKFYRAANRLLATEDEAGGTTNTGDVGTQTIGAFIADGGYGREFVDLHLVPMGAAVWSAEPEAFTDFPAISLLRFFKNHGLLGVGRRPQWRTVVGGSRRYVEALTERFDGAIHTSSPIERVSRVDDPDGGARRVDIRVAGRTERFDVVVMACHSDQALALISDATPTEKDVLGSIRYQPNRATLHTDASVMSPHRKAWAAWNYDRRGDGGTTATLTYDMTALQQLRGSRRYLVSLNSDHVIDPETVIGQYDYAHPIFDNAAITAQSRFEEVSGVDGLHFCGAYWRYGFHEDGMASGLRVCEQLGVTW